MKENKGGFLHNNQIEEDLRVKGKSGEQNGYSGSQDTGDKMRRQDGSDVQQRDGFVPEKGQNEED